MTRSRALVLMITAYFAAIAAALKWSFDAFAKLYQQFPGAFWAVVLGPLLFIVAFDIVPNIARVRRRRQREKRALEPAPLEDTPDTPYFRLDPYVRQKPTDFRRQDGAHERVLRWVRESSRPILFLSGISGTGKSSVLDGYVLPILNDDKAWLVIRVRAAPIPFSELEAALNTSRRADVRLLIVFDQFEEFIVLSEGMSAEQRERFCTRVRELRSAPADLLVLLFTFRSDYRGDVEALDLDELDPMSRPARGEGRGHAAAAPTWIEIGPFGRSAAREFLQKSPPKPLEELVNKLLNGADALDDTPGLYRPVTLNMLGLMLDRFDGQFTGSPERLVQAYFETTIAEMAIRDIAPRVVKEMITASATKRAHTVTSLAAATGLAISDVRACLYRLWARGLARRLGGPEGVWELSHDFVARQFAVLLRHLQPGFWPRVAIVMAPILFVLGVGGIVVAVPAYIEYRALQEFSERHLIVYRIGDQRVAALCRDENAAEGSATIPFICVGGDRDADLAAVAPFIAQTNISILDLVHTSITKLDGISNLLDLRELSIDDNEDISSLAPLARMTKLETLSASSTNVTDLTPITGLRSLRILDISATGVKDFRPLLSLPSLETVSVPNLSSDSETVKALRDRGAEVK